MQAIAFILTTALYLFCICTSAFALTKEELLAYSDNVKNIVEENMFQLEPGSLKKTPLSQEEKHKKTRALMKIVGDPANKNWAHDALSYYSVFFRKCAERLSKEIEIRDPDLVAWNKKRLAGYQDSHEVTKLALSLLKTPDAAGLKIALANKELAERIRANAKYHHSLRAELENIIKSHLPEYSEVRRLSRELTGSYVETTWK